MPSAMTLARAWKGMPPPLCAPLVGASKRPPVCLSGIAEACMAEWNSWRRFGVQNQAAEPLVVHLPLDAAPQRDAAAADSAQGLAARQKPAKVSAGGRSTLVRIGQTRAARPQFGLLRRRQALLGCRASHKSPSGPQQQPKAPPLPLPVLPLGARLALLPTTICGASLAAVLTTVICVLVPLTKRPQSFHMHVGGALHIPTNDAQDLPQLQQAAAQRHAEGVDPFEVRPCAAVPATLRQGLQGLAP